MDWSYVAGFFDGEGCITRNGRSGNCPAVTIGQAESNRLVIDALAGFLDGQGIAYRLYRYETRHRPSHKTLGISAQPFIRIDIHTHAAAEKMLSGMLPYLVLKATKAAATLAFIRGRTWAPWVRHSDAQYRAAHALYLTGLSARDVTKRVGIHHRTLLSAWRLLSLPVRTQEESTRLWRSIKHGQVAPPS